MVKIAFIDEYDKWIKSLSIKEDILLILYYKGSDNVPLSLLQSINSAKCKLEFIEIEDIFADKKLNLSYTLGTLKERFKNIKSLSDNDSVNKVFGSSKTTARVSTGKTTTKIAGKPTGKTAAKPAPAKSLSNSTVLNTEPSPTEKKVKKPRVSKTIAEKSQIISSPNNSEILEIDDTHTEKPLKKTAESKPSKETLAEEKTKPNDSIDNKAMESFVKYLKSFKTKQFDPSKYASSIISAVRQADKDNIPLDEALMYCCTPNIHKTLVEVFKDKDKELSKLVLSIPR